MKKIITNTFAALALVAGIVIGATGHGILACLAGVALAWAGAVTLISKSTDWIWNA